MSVRSGVVVVAGSLALIGAGLTGPTSARADSSTPAPLYAYATGTGTPAGCPQEASAPAGCSLAAAIAALAPGGTILLATSGSDAHYVGNWKLAIPGADSDPITIEPAPGATNPTLDGNGGQSSGCGTASCGRSILTVYQSIAATIAGVTFTNGDSASGGGAILNVNGQLAVANDTFTNNVAGPFTSGGAIENNGGLLFVSGDDFASDSAPQGNGGAIDNGAIVFGAIAVDGSTFTDNSVGPDGVGGAISNGVAGGSGLLEVQGSTFDDNSTAGSGYGGAIANGDLQGSGTADVSTSTFTENSATVGGAVSNGDDVGSGQLSVVASTFATDDADTGSEISNGNDGSGTVTVAADVFAGSCAKVIGDWVDEGYNVSVDSTCVKGGPSDASLTGAQVGAPADNGGPTQTMLLLSGNPGIGLVPNGTEIAVPGGTESLCPTIDQRNIISPAGDACDAGAVQGTTAQPSPDQISAQGSPSSGTAGSPVTLSVTVTADPDAFGPPFPQPAGTVSFSSEGTALCTATLDADGIGSCQSSALPAGSDPVHASYIPTNGYAAATNDFTEQVLGSQAIQVTQPSAAVVGGSTTLDATGGDSGNAVAFSVDPATSPAGACSLSGSTVSYLLGGTCVIDANQAGSSSYSAAPQVQVTIPITKAGTTTKVMVSATALTAAVSSNASGAGTPSGSVTFEVDGAAVGTASLNSAGVATLAHPSVGAEGAGATYSGDAAFESSSGSTATRNPTITAKVTSAHPARHGWYRQPVKVSFSCHAGSGTLVTSCPKPVTVSRDGAAQTVTRTIVAADGGIATVSVAPNVDQTPPVVKLKGVKAGKKYSKSALKHAKCTATDVLSGLAGKCKVKVSHHGKNATVTASATDQAGNVGKQTLAVRLR